MPPRVVDHMGFAVRNLAASERFYEAALAPLGFRLMYRTPEATVFGTDGADDFSIYPDAPPTTGAHVAFAANSRDAVEAFYRAALTAGGRSNVAPATHAEYHPGYYAAFVFDPDGNNVEAVFHDR